MNRRERVFRTLKYQKSRLFLCYNSLKLGFRKLIVENFVEINVENKPLKSVKMFKDLIRKRVRNPHEPVTVTDCTASPNRLGFHWANAREGENAP